ncbi:MAG TPA: cytochrome c3 family protein [Anaeromyxobacteraceae bacterium]|nr:cytochrome c3 family protein [Anaeromyxobacteraceae bacterium]
MSPRSLAACLTLAALAAGAALAAEKKANRLAPVDSQAASTHSPFEAGDCATCHQKPGGGGPGKLGKAVNEICFDCHDEFKGSLARKMRHPPPKDDCTSCHNPHNSRKRKLLL